MADWLWALRMWLILRLAGDAALVINARLSQDPILSFEKGQRALVYNCTFSTLDNITNVKDESYFQRLESEMASGFHLQYG